MFLQNFNPSHGNMELLLVPFTFVPTMIVPLIQHLQVLINMKVTLAPPLMAST